MKYIYILIFNVVVFTTLVAQDDQVIDYTYDEIIPNLEIMKTKPRSGISFPKSDVYYKEYVDDVFVISTKVLKSSDLFKMLGKEIIYKLNDAEKYIENIVTLKRLEIVVDSFTLDKSFRIPGCDIVIDAKVIDMKNNIINTSGYNYRYSDLSNLKESVAGTLKANGKNGMDGGDVNMKSKQIINVGKIIVNGGNGECRFAPTISIDRPDVYDGRKQAYGNHGCGADQTKRSETVKFKKEQNIIALLFTNFNLKAFNPTPEKCLNNDILADSISINANGYFKEEKKASRISFGDIKAGNGGACGSVNVYTEIPIDRELIVVNKVGMGGMFKVRNDTEDVKYIDAGNGLCNKFEIQGVYYYGASIVTTSNPIGTVSAEVTDRKHISIELPNQQEYKSIEWNWERYNTIDYNRNGNYFQPVIRNGKQFLPSYNYMKYRIDLVRYFYDQYDVLPSNVKRECEALLSQVEEDMSLNLLNNTSQKYMELNLVLTSLINRKYSNADKFGNPPGYRPMLSLKNSVTLLDTNLEGDVRQFVLADLRNDKRIADSIFYKNIPKMIGNIESDIISLSGKRKILSETLLGLNSDMLLCKSQTDSINKEIIKLTREIKKKAEKDSKKMAVVVGLLKTAALAASVIPFGQPALAEIGGKGINSLADYIDNDTKDPVEACMNTIGEIDLSKMMNAYVTNKEIKFTGPKIAKPDEKKISLEDIGVFKSDDHKKVWVENKKIKEANSKYNNLNKKAQKDYEKRIKAYNKKKERTLKMATGTSKILLNAFKNSMDSKKMEKLYSQLSSSNVAYSKLVRMLKAQHENKARIFSVLTTNVQKIQKIDVEIALSVGQIKELLDIKFNNNPDLHNFNDFCKELRQDALSEINWIEYQLIKSFEYSMLSDELSLSNSSYFETIYNSKKLEYGDSKDIDIDKFVKDVSTDFLGIRTKISNTILKINKRYRQDVNARSIHLIAKDSNNTLGSAKLQQLNVSKNKSVVLDLKRDLLSTILKPEEAEVRIVDISVGKVVLESPLPVGVEFDIIATLDDEGVLMSTDNRFYLYNSNSGNAKLDSWKWTITGNGTVTNKSEISDKYLGLIKLFTGDNSGGKSSEKFTYPPAWSKLNIQLVSRAPRVKLPKIKELLLHVTCDNVERDDSYNLVLDVRQDNNPPMSELTVTSNGNSNSTFSDLYMVVPQGEPVTISIDPNNISLFKEWFIDNAMHSPDDIRNPSISIVPTGNTVVEASYYSLTEDIAVKSTILRRINVYENASPESDIIDVVNSESEYNVLDADFNSDYLKVVYRMGEGYIKKSDLD